MQFLSYSPIPKFINYSSAVKQPHKQHLNKQIKVNITSNEQFDNVCHRAESNKQNQASFLFLPQRCLASMETQEKPTQAGEMAQWSTALANNLSSNSRTHTVQGKSQLSNSGLDINMACKVHPHHTHEKAINQINQCWEGVFSVLRERQNNQLKKKKNLQEYVARLERGQWVKVLSA